MTSYLLMNINELGAMALGFRVLRLSFYNILLENLREIHDLISSHEH